MYNKARRMAMSNGHVFHIAAIVKRRGKVIRICTNSRQKRKQYFRYYDESASSNPGVAACEHAEMAALRYAKPGDTIYVIRWKKDGSLGCARPCRHCRPRLKNRNVNVRYINEHGTWSWLFRS